MTIIIDNLRSVQRRFIAVLSFFLFIPISLHATVVQFSTEDKGTGAIPNVLLILKSLEDGHEVFRTLTDESGQIAGRDLKPGLYRIIATCPYGFIETKVREFLVGEKPIKLVLTLDATGSDDSVILGSPTRVVQVLDRDGIPVSGALVIARDTTATHEKWSKTDRLGETVVALIGDPTVLEIVTSTKLTEHVIRTDEGSQRKGQGSTLAPDIVIRMPQ